MPERQHSLYVDNSVWKRAGEKSKRHDSRPIGWTGGRLVAAYGHGRITPDPADNPVVASRTAKLIKIDDADWAAAERRAMQSGTSISAAFEALLVAYSDGRLKIVTTVVQEPATVA
ncbi:hypothetical protein [Streptomyces sp. NBC_01465]|uniref:hypothetical protein n=1 Tax=Streptomyces sp. NBC_01465 TaxID=2903878 RepID=UPI002E34E4E2|nr:hypothetical protein [Streptomyces sp. NBC_01465]